MISRDKVELFLVSICICLFFPLCFLPVHLLSNAHTRKRECERQILLRGANGAVHVPGQAKITITRRRATAAAAMFYFVKSRQGNGLAGLTSYGAPAIYLIRLHRKRLKVLKIFC